MSQPQTAAHANELNSRLGQDLCLQAELDDYEEEAAEAEKWEREGREEMYSTLGLVY